MTRRPKILDGNGMWGGRLFEWESLASTNAWALEQGAALRHGDVVWARHQTAGHGRMARRWVTPADRCLAFSAVIDDPPLAGFAANVGQAAAIAVVAAFDRLAVVAFAKWPNDVYVSGRKAAGILVEMDSRSPTRMVLGIGINVNMTRRELADRRIGRPATSLRAETGRRFALEEVLRFVLREVRDHLDGLARDGVKPLLDMWRERDWLAGRNVTVDTAAGRLEGKCLGLDEEGRLRVLDRQGIEHSLCTGDADRVGGWEAPGGI